MVFGANLTYHNHLIELPYVEYNRELGTPFVIIFRGPRTVIRFMIYQYDTQTNTLIELTPRPTDAFMILHADYLPEVIYREDRFRPYFPTIVSSQEIRAYIET